MTAAAEASSFLYGANSEFIEQLYQRYLISPRSLDQSWQDFFDGLGDEADSVLAELRGASWSPKASPRAEPEPFDPFAEQVELMGVAAQAPAAVGAVSGLQIRQATLDSLRALMMIRAYRVRGHLKATLDPLALHPVSEHPELDPKSYGFDDAAMDRPIFINYVLGLESATLREILDIVNRTYCGNIGVEFMHMQGPAEKAWIQERMEGRYDQLRYRPAERREILAQLTQAEGFERFLHMKYTGTKRFGLEGAESLMPLMESLTTRAAELGVREISLGMPHRGRLNVLANFMEKSHTAIFSEFQGNVTHPEDVQGSGDVKYHLGTSADREFGGYTVHLSLSANPSHLEAADPVVIGKARAKQSQRGDDSRSQVMAVLLHGDAAFAGQGLVAECFALSDVAGYSVGGTVHIIVNNQIGFTTNPISSRSSPYASDVAKTVQSPVFHVNGDDPEAVCRVAELAAEYRQRFKQDIVIDMFCYRRHGHNEGDEPMFTQPIMYRQIAEHPTTRQIYADRLVAEGQMSREEVDGMAADCQQRMEQSFEAASGFKQNKADWLEGVWSGLERARGEARRGNTDVKLEVLREIGQGITQVPESYKLHRTVRRLIENKRRVLESGEDLDWATAEALAFGSLLREGFPVRLSGQDSARGTFSQRHSAFTDQEDERIYIPLQNLSQDQAAFEVINSPLSEAAVLGFEYGYSLAEPQGLVLWEAQFGDFANGAQVIIDQFLAGAESKWLRMSGLVMLLPHGFEGQGPEHSSARLERYLQLCAEDNIQVANCTTPANYFHILRRQMHRKFRKPLILMTPKSLLRHKRCVSRIEDMAERTTFHRVLWDDLELNGDDSLVPPEKVRRVVLCTGKVYYDLAEAREEMKRKSVYLMRLEQLYPFPKRPLMKELARFPNAEIYWCQEEPQNMGAWWFAMPRIDQVLKKIGHKCQRTRYFGRPESASTAAGSLAMHRQEQEKLVRDALGIRGNGSEG
ncbi:MAG: 2-oxoglutarate dehydrogenase E1 component [Alphaproteobacteria bacterium]|jgi:2-oxoglutarate dehydrogenase E1 component|nr:2-oxoglutarate dehydrogenase E1 component [Alphaproteobacteria bacterium]